uniref:Peptidase A1 domain-containing protein n=1 Tax=Clastoptera arizonana TaxID=38151 RepID=A0A1B6DWG7_9HEMI
MIFSFVTAILLSSVLGISGIPWETLRVKFAILGGYWKMPLTVDEILLKEPNDFQFVDKDVELNVDIYSHPQDPRFFLLFDTYGNIAGIRTGYIKSDIEKKSKEQNLTFPYNYGEISMFKEGKFWNRDIWYIDILFVNPQKLIIGGREDTLGQVADGVYIILDGTWVEIARDECEVENQGFTKQGCVMGMGQHYFYKTTPSLDCKEFQPFFAMYDYGQLVGFGISTFGSSTFKDGGQEWFEHPPRKLTEIIIPKGPPCAYEWTEKFEVTALHFFFRNDAKQIACPKSNATYA